MKDKVVSLIATQMLNWMTPLNSSQSDTLHKLANILYIGILRGDLGVHIGVHRSGIGVHIGVYKP